MKSLPEFANLEIGTTDIIVVSYPTEKEASKLYIDDKTRQAMAKELPMARPMVVAKVGEGYNACSDTRIQLKRGDFVFLLENFSHQAMLLGMDTEQRRRWNNPIIMPNAPYAIGAKVIYAEEWEKEYEAIAEKITEIIKGEQDRVNKK